MPIPWLLKVLMMLDAEEEAVVWAIPENLYLYPDFWEELEAHVTHEL